MVELYNTTDQPINIGGWFLSDASEDLTKYQIAANTDPGARLPRADRERRLRLGLGRSRLPRALRLQRARRRRVPDSNASGVAGGYREHVDFGATPNGVYRGPVTQINGRDRLHAARNAHLRPRPQLPGGSQQRPVPRAAGAQRGHVPPGGRHARRDRRRLRHRRLRVRRALQPLRHRADASQLLRRRRGRLYLRLVRRRRPWARVLDPRTRRHGHLDGHAVLPNGTYEVFARYDLYDGQGQKRNLDDAAQYPITTPAGRRWSPSTRTTIC